MTSNPVSDDDIVRFDTYVVKWQQALNLQDWRINTSPIRAKGKVMAYVFKIDLEQRMASIRVGNDFGPHPVTDRSLEETALHEVMHVFLHELIEAAKVPDQDQDTIRSAEHRIINVLERLLADKL